MCSYCGCENIEVVGRFMREHTEIVNASGVLRAACDAGSQDAIAAAAAEVARLFAPHSAAEEAGIFTVMAEDPEFTDYVTRLCSEHEQLDAHLADVVLTAGQLAALTPGATLPLSLADPPIVRLRAGDRVVATAALVEADGGVALQIVRVTLD